MLLPKNFRTIKRVFAQAVEPYVRSWSGDLYPSLAPTLEWYSMIAKVTGTGLRMFNVQYSVLYHSSEELLTVDRTTAHTVGLTKHSTLPLLKVKG